MTLAKKLLKSIFLFILSVTVRLKLHKTAAKLCKLSLQPVKLSQKPAKYRILTLPKLGFKEDILNIFEKRDNIDIVTFPKILVKTIFSVYLPYFIDDNNYISCGKEYDQAKKNYREFCFHLLNELHKIYKFDAVLTANFSYSIDKEFSAALTQLGIPFIALHKENLKTPGLADFFERIYRERRGPFKGTKVLTYNQIEKDIQLRAGVVNKEAVEVVGMPRLDELHEWRHKNVGQVVKNKILFFAFTSETGMPLIMRKTKKMGQTYAEKSTFDNPTISVKELCKDTYDALVQLAKDHPEIEVVIKSKGRNREFDLLLQHLNVSSISELPGNIRLVHGGAVKELLADCAVVCGFKSTALCEAIAMGKPVVSPWFAEANNPDYKPYLLDLRRVCQTAESYEDVYAMLLEAAQAGKPVPRDLSEEECETLDMWTGNSDGLSAQRAYNAIINTIES